MQRQYNEFTNQISQSQHKIKRNQKIELGVHAIDSLDIIAIFSSFLKPFLIAFLESYSKYALFPLAAAASIVKAGLAWRQLALDKNEANNKFKPNLLVKSLVETITALSITTAVVGALAFSAIFAAITPIIFASTIAAKSIFHMGCALYYWGKASSATHEDTKMQSNNTAKANVISSLSNALIAAAVVGVMIFAHPLLAPWGIAAGILGATYAVVKLSKLISQDHPKKTQTSTAAYEQQTGEENTVGQAFSRKNQKQINNNTLIYKTFSPEPTSDNQDKDAEKEKLKAYANDRIPTSHPVFSGSPEKTKRKVTFDENPYSDIQSDLIQEDRDTEIKSDLSTYSY